MWQPLPGAEAWWLCTARCDDICAEAKGAKSVVLQESGEHRLRPQIEGYFPEPRYIYLYRDGRDVAVSFRKAVVARSTVTTSPGVAATQELAIALRRKIATRALPEHQLRGAHGRSPKNARLICAFLGGAIPGTPMLDYHRTDEAKRAATSSELWVNVTSPRDEKQ